MHGDDAEHEGGGEKDRTGRRAVVTAEAYVVDTGRRRTWPMLMAVPLVSSSRPLGVTVAVPSRMRPPLVNPPEKMNWWLSFLVVSGAVVVLLGYEQAS